MGECTEQLWECRIGMENNLSPAPTLSSSLALSKQRAPQGEATPGPALPPAAKEQSWGEEGRGRALCCPPSSEMATGAPPASPLPDSQLRGCFLLDEPPWLADTAEVSPSPQWWFLKATNQPQLLILKPLSEWMQVETSTRRVKEITE